MGIVLEPRSVDRVLWVLSGAALVAIVVFSLGPGPPSGGFSLFDKLQHAAAYAVLTGSVLLAAVWRPGRGDGPFPRSAPSIALGAMALGVLLEVAQAIGPFGHRSADPLDGLADAAGIGCATLAWAAVKFRAT
jgi:hypothetical protein